MQEVTQLNPYNQYGGRVFKCTQKEAEDYVVENCKTAHHVDVLHGIISKQVENVVWWESEHSWSDKGTNKIAHWSKSQGILVVYCQNCEKAAV